MYAQLSITPTQRRLQEQRRERLKRLNPSAPPCPKPSQVKTITVKEYRPIVKQQPERAGADTQPTPIPIEIKKIIAETCLETGFTATELTSPKRIKGLVAARNKGMWRARHETVHSLSRIGAAFNRERTTVAHSIAQHQKRIAREAASGDAQTHISSCVTKTAPLAHVHNIGINNTHSP